MLAMSEDEAHSILSNANPNERQIELKLIKAFESLPPERHFKKFKDLLNWLGRDKEKSKGPYYNKIRRCWHISRLPKGILWKVKQGKISVSHASIIAKLSDENDQYILALGIVSYSEKIGIALCNKIVRLVNKGKDGKCYSIREALDKVASVRFKNIPQGLDMRSPDEWIDVNREAWEREMEWETFCHNVISQKANVLTDIEKVETEVLSIKTRLGQLAEEIGKVESQLEGVAKKLLQLSKLN